MTARSDVRSLYFTPPMAIARLGGSDTPLDAFVWREDPTTLGGGLTSLEPAVSLRVEDDGSVSPYRPVDLVFRDGRLLRPAAPFLELWVEYDDGATEPLTSALLAELGGTLEGVHHRVAAANAKAARRSGDPACAFSAAVDVDHAAYEPVELLASSTGTRPLVAADRPIPLGRVQVIRPVAGGLDPVHGVDGDVLRLRFTPAKGLVYGPPTAVEGVYDVGGPERQLRHQIVPPEHRILNQDSAWTEYTLSRPELRHPSPGDTYDGSGDPTSPDDRSWGVVDDTCDVLVTTTVVLAGATHVAHARVFVGPPDYGPDKRPFVSLVDDLVDRSEPDADDDTPLAALEVADLLRRAFETVSLDNVDLQRRRGLRENELNRDGLLGAADDQGTGESLRARYAVDPENAQPPRADRASMTDDDVGYRDSSRHQLRGDTRLPFSALARDAHSELTAMPVLLEFLKNNADRVRRLIRPPYALVRESEPAAPIQASGFRRPWDADARVHDMRMPPYMR
ncbi:MAG: hypothetical protein ACR2HV_04365, partial [Acidimicrobiales bacterium]